MTQFIRKASLKYKNVANKISQALKTFRSGERTLDFIIEALAHIAGGAVLLICVHIVIGGNSPV